MEVVGFTDRCNDCGYTKGLSVDPTECDICDVTVKCANCIVRHHAEAVKFDEENETL